jgi:hypothetical protein
MKARWFFIALLSLGVLWVFQAFPLHAQRTPKTLTLLYSNNFNGEVEPCPT